MKEFEQLCKEFEEMEPLKYGSYLMVKSTELMPLLDNINIDGLDGISIFYLFVLGAAGADGEFSEEEYFLTSPLLRQLFGESIDYTQASNLFYMYKNRNDELKKFAESMKQILLKLPNDIREDIIIICMMICAVDGKINQAERDWIMQLLK